MLPNGTPVLAQVHVFGKGERERNVPLHPECWAAVEDLGQRRADSAPAAFLFAKLDESAWSRKMIWRRVAQWGRRAGVDDCTPHRFRHRFATDAYERTRNLKAVQELLGHTSLSTTQIYLGLVDQDRTDAILSLGPAPDVSRGCVPPDRALETAAVTPRNHGGHGVGPHIVRTTLSVRRRAVNSGRESRRMYPTAPGTTSAAFGGPNDVTLCVCRCPATDHDVLVSADGRLIGRCWECWACHSFEAAAGESLR
jgi:hypothetical protein